jgi:hypothetical protein
MKIKLYLVLFFCLSFIVLSCSKQKYNNEETAKMDKEYEQLIAQYEAKMKPAYRDMSLQYFIAATNSTPENWEIYAQKEMAVNKILSDKELLLKSKKLKNRIELKTQLKNEESRFCILHFSENKLTLQNSTRLLNSKVK